MRHNRTFRLVYSPVDATVRSPGEFKKGMQALNEEIRKALQSKLEIELR